MANVRAINKPDRNWRATPIVTDAHQYSTQWTQDRRLHNPTRSVANQKLTCSATRLLLDDSDSDFLKKSTRHLRSPGSMHTNKISTQRNQIKWSESFWNYLTIVTQEIQRARISRKKSVVVGCVKSCVLIYSHGSNLLCKVSIYV